MKDFYTLNIKSPIYTLFIIILLSLTSCGSYQSAYNEDDGIYATPNSTETVIVEETSSNGEVNYFLLKLNEYKSIDDGDLITNVDDYYYDDSLEEQYDTIYVDDVNYTNESAAWGTSNNVSVSFTFGAGFNYGYGYGYPYYGRSEERRVGKEC